MRRNTRRAWTGFVAGITAMAAIVGGGSAAAYFATTTTASGSVATHSIAITANNFIALDATYINSELAHTDSFTVHNTGQTSGTANISISAVGPLAASLPVTVWPVAQTSSCHASATVGAGAVSATWASISITTTLALAAGASQAYCVRTQITDRPGVAHVTGAQSATATLSAVLTGEGWTASATEDLTAVQRTADIFPLDGAVVPGTGASRWFTMSNGTATGVCADSSGNGMTAGTNVVTMACDTTASQRWRLRPVSEDDRSLVFIEPKHVPGVRLGVDAAGTQQLQTSADLLAQKWYLQKASTTTWQLVSAVDGRCLVVNNTATGTPTTVAACTAPNTKLTLTREPLIFVPNGTSYRLDLTATVEVQKVVLQQRLLGILNWVDVTTLSSGSIINVNMLLALLGDYEFRVVYESNKTVVLYEGSVSKILLGEVEPRSGFE